MIPHTLSEFGAAVAEASWRASWLIGVVLLLRFALRGRMPAQVWFFAWLLVAARLLVPVSVPATWSPFGWSVAPATPRAAAAEPVPALSSEAAPTRENSPGILSAPSAALENNAAEKKAIAAGGAARAFSRSPREWLARAWLAGGFVLLMLRVGAEWQFRRRLRGATLPADARLAETIAHEANALGLRGEMRVFETAAVDVPALHGIWRPRLLFPPGLAARLDETELQLVVRHELAHWRRRDLLAQTLVHIAVIVHWFNPLVWLAARFARHDGELACDEFVLRRDAADARAYGAVLLKVLGMTPPARRASLAAVGILERRGSLVQRVRRIVEFRAGGARRLAAGLLGLALLTAASLTREARAGAVPASGSEDRGEKNAVASPAAPAAPATSLASNPTLPLTSAPAPVSGLSLAEIHAEQMREFRAQGADLTRLSFIAEQPLVSELMRRLSEQQLRLAALSERYAERHPQVIEAKRLLDETEKQLARAVESACARIQAESDAAARQHTAGGVPAREAEAIGRLSAALQQREQELQAQRTQIDQLRARIADAPRSPETKSDFTVSVVGAVNQQGAVSFRENARPIVLEAIARAGGFAPNADRGAVRLLRRSADGIRTLQLSEDSVMFRPGATDDTHLEPDDVIVVAEKNAGPPRMVSVNGQVTKPGRIAFSEEGRLGLVDAITIAGGPTRLADMKRVRVTRRAANGEFKVFTLNLADVFGSGSGAAPGTGPTAEPFELEPGDMVFIPERIL